jgi:fucose 4-O-acetylase-like acetyltransferase
VDRGRNPGIDALRGIAVLLVVVGHSIQYANGAYYRTNGLFYENIVFKLIYGFHMPLFMIISGFLFSRSLPRRSAREVVAVRFRRLLVPILVWGTVSYVITTLVVHTSDTTSARAVIGDYVRCLNGLWFLWALLLSTILVAIIYSYMHNSWWLYALLIAIGLVVPDDHNLALYKYMLPYFVLPSFLKHERLYSYLRTKGRLFLGITLALMLVAYGAAMWFWRRDFYIYTSGITLLGRPAIPQLAIDMARWVVGLLGVSTALLAAYALLQRCRVPISRVLIVFGRQAIGVYILSTVAFSYVVPNVTKASTFSWWRVAGIAVAVSSSTVLLTILASKSRRLDALLFGRG